MIGGVAGTHNSLALLDVDLVSQHNLPAVLVFVLPAGGLGVLAHEWEVLGVPRRGLDQELVTPAVESVEALGVVDVEDQNTAVGTSVECHAQRLEALLTGRVPQLRSVSSWHGLLVRGCGRVGRHYLHGDLPVVDQDLTGQEVGADGGLVARAELLIDLGREKEKERQASAVVRRAGGQRRRKRAATGASAGTGEANILVHQAGLADTAIAKDNDLDELALAWEGTRREHRRGKKRALQGDGPSRGPSFWKTWRRCDVARCAAARSEGSSAVPAEGRADLERAKRVTAMDSARD